MLSLARMKNKDFEKIREDEKLMRVEKAKEEAMEGMENGAN